MSFEECAGGDKVSVVLLDVLLPYGSGGAIINAPRNGPVSGIWPCPSRMQPST